MVQKTKSSSGLTFGFLKTKTSSDVFSYITGAWLTTGGMHSGVTKDVGEALRDYAIGRAMAEHRSIVTLGIVPLSVLKHQQKLKAGQVG